MYGKLFRFLASLQIDQEMIGQPWLNCVVVVQENHSGPVVNNAVQPWFDHG